MIVTCGHHILAMIHFSLKGETRFCNFGKKNILKTALESSFILNKIRKKTLNVTYNMKKMAEEKLNLGPMVRLPIGQA